MSDAMWDMEYSKAYDLKQEIREFCQEHNLEEPKFRDFARSWELEPMLQELKEKYQ